MKFRLFTISVCHIYEYGDGAEEKKAARIAERIDVFQRLGIPLEKEDPSYLTDNIIVTQDHFFSLMLANQEPKIIREIPIPSDYVEGTIDGALAQFNLMAQKLLGMPGLQSAASPQFNERVQVHMPGQALSTYNEVLLLEDHCSDALQGKLNDGWRIIAACPQPDQCRPDYILGRFNPEFDAREGASAKRD